MEEPSAAHSPRLESQRSLWVAPWGFILDQSHLLGDHWVLLGLLPLLLCIKGRSCLYPGAGSSGLSSGVVPWVLEEGEWWGPGWDMAGAEATERTKLNFLRNSQFVQISPLSPWISLLGWEPNKPSQAGLGNKIILEQGFKSPFKDSKRLPEVTRL